MGFSVNIIHCLLSQQLDHYILSTSASAYGGGGIQRDDVDKGLVEVIVSLGLCVSRRK